MIWPMPRRSPWQPLQPEIPNPKTQIPSNIQIPNSNSVVSDSPKPRDLEERTFLFAQAVRRFVKALPRTVGNSEDVRQLVRASGSVAANWIEANEALSKKDFLVRAKICRKESKESRLFLRLIETTDASANKREELSGEARELTLIFSSIISKNDPS
jgi:four helix bundle protein